MTIPLFDASVIPQAAKRLLPAGVALRPLELEDYDKGFLKVLSELTTVGDISKEVFTERFNDLKAAGVTYILVLEQDLGDNETRIVGSGTLHIEKKFIHQCAACGHIEDIVVSSSQRGKSLGKAIVQALILLSKAVGAYKCILDCTEANVGFYERCHLTKVGAQMSIKWEDMKIPERRGSLPITFD